MNSIKGSFVILNFNRKDEVIITIAKTLALISKNPSTFEIIVVDNKSADGSASAIEAAYPEINIIDSKTSSGSRVNTTSNITLIKRDVNNGIAGWNDGFKAAKGDYLIVLDDDSHMEGGLTEAVEYMDKNLDVGILALNITGGAFQTDTHVHDKEYINFIGCGAVIRKSLFNKIGGFSEWMMVYSHEFEYGIRCIEAGYKIKYFEKGLVIHRTSAVNRSKKRLRTFTLRNELGIVYKFFNKEQKQRYLLRVFLHNLKNIRTDGVSTAIWYIKGLREFLKLKKQLNETPVKKEVQEFYTDQFVSTKPFLKII